MNTNLSRRAALTGAAAAACAVPSGAIAKDRCTFPDLAAELTAVRNRWIAHNNVCRARCKAADAYAYATTGITEAEARADQCNTFEGRMENGPKWTAWSDAWGDYVEANQDVDDPVDEDGSSIIWTQIHEDMRPACEAILAQPARTVTDLGVIAQAFALDAIYKFIDEQKDNEGAIRFAEAVCTFCGIEPLPGIEYPPLSEAED